MAPLKNPTRLDITDLAIEFQSAIIESLSGKMKAGDSIEMISAAATRFEGGVQEHIDRQVQRRLLFKKPANDNNPYPGIISSADFVRGFTPPDYHIDGIIQSRFFYSLTGMTGTGKTAVMLLIAAATAMGGEIAGRYVKPGRVVYLAGENPDDVAMRWIAAAHHIGFDPESVDVHFMKGTTDVAETLDSIRADVEKLGGADLVMLDTSAAFFFGTDENSNTEAGRHARQLRELTTLPGKPAVIVACHPVKNASADNLLPRGGGAFIAEVDGNLTLAKSNGLVKMHWQGKHRGPDFEPIMFKLETVTAPTLIDSRGRPVPTVLSKDMSEREVSDVNRQAFGDLDAVLIEIERDGAQSTSAMAESIGWHKESKPDKRRVQSATDRLKREKLAKYEARKWKLTEQGQEALVDAKARRHEASQAAGFAARMRDKMG